MSGLDCREFRAGTEKKLREHAASCASCAGWLEGQAQLTTGLRALAEETSDAGLPSGLESLLMAKFEAAHRRPAVFMRSWRPFAVAAAVLLSIAGLSAWRLLRSPVPHPAPARVVIAEAPAKEPKNEVQAEAPKVRLKRATVRKNMQKRDAPFFLIPYTAPLAPYERASLMRVDMPVSQLIAAGLPISVRDTGAQARADLILGEDGRARAVRLVSISSFDSPEAVSRRSMQ